MPKPAPKRKRPRGPRVDRDVRQLVIERAGFVCDRCPGSVTGWDGGSVHHIDPAGMGGSKLVHVPEWLVLLCGSGTTGCHGEVESDREQAIVDGWVRGPGQAPQVPVLRHGRHRVYPTATGWLPAELGPGGEWRPVDIAC